MMTQVQCPFYFFSFLSYNIACHPIAYDAINILWQVIQWHMYLCVLITGTLQCSVGTADEPKPILAPSLQIQWHMYLCVLITGTLQCLVGTAYEPKPILALSLQIWYQCVFVCSTVQPYWVWWGLGQVSETSTQTPNMRSDWDFSTQAEARQL